MFQSTPVIADGRSYVLLHAGKTKTGFQSTPVIADGRSQWVMVMLRCLSCFNPRPSLLTGEAVPEAVCLGVAIVSIHARHC